MKERKTSSLLVAVAMTIAASAQAGQQSEPAGYYHVTVPPNSDGIIAVPLDDQVSYQGVVQSVAGNVITVSGSPFVAGQYTNGLSYVRFVSGANVGLWATITNNTANTLTVQTTDPAVVSNIAAGHRFVIQAHATLASVFPPADAGKSFIASLGTSGAQRRTEVVVLDHDGQKINRSAASGGVYYYFNGWRQAITGNPLAGNTVLPPQRPFILRNRNNPTTSLTFQKVLTPYPWVLGAPAVAGTVKNDNLLATGQLGKLTLDELDLVGTGAFTPSAGTSGAQRKDELLVFDNAASGINKGAAAIYYCTKETTGSPNHSNAIQWRQATTGNPIVTHTPLIDAATGFVIRRAAQASTQTNNWVNAPGN